MHEKEPFYMYEEGEAMTKVKEVVFGGRLDIGQGNIASRLQSEQEISAFGEVIKDAIKPIEKPNAACCVDGRKCLHNADNSPAPIMHQLPGGLLVAAYAAAELAGWSRLSSMNGAPTADRLAAVEQFMADNGFDSYIHTSDHAIASAEGTECGASDKLPQIWSRIPARSELILPVLEALNDGQLSPEQHAIIERQKQRAAKMDMSSWGSVALRDRMIESSPDHVQVLQSGHDATHNHRENALVIVDDKEMGIDRDSLAENDQQVFVYSRAFQHEIARLMATSPQEEAALNIAFGTYLAATGDQLFAPGMPVYVVRTV